MKTQLFNNIASRTAIIVAAIILGLNFTSCASADADDINSAESSEKVTSAHVTFKYTVPEELLKYAEINVAYNNNEGTDSKWEPMLDNTFTVNYDITKFPITAPVVLLYDFTNRPAGGHNVNWDLKMDVEVTMNIGGRTVIKTHSTTYTISGDAGKGLENLMKSNQDRTYAVSIAKNGSLQFIH